MYWTSGTVRDFWRPAVAVAVLVAGLLVLYMSLFVGRRVGGQRGHDSAVRQPPACCWRRPPGSSAEYVRAHLFGGFPWIPLGNAVVTLLPIAQLASVGGVYGVSWFLATLNACFALRRHDRRAAASGGGRRRLGLVAACSLWGVSADQRQPFDARRAADPVGLIQGNIPQTEKWDPVAGSDDLRSLSADDA